MQIFSLEAIVNVLTGKAEGQLKQLEREAEKAGEGMAGGFERARIGALRLAGGAVLGALSAVLVKVAGDALALGRILNDEFARIQGRTGATDAQIKRLQQTFNSLFKEGVAGATNQQIASALEAIQREMGDLGNQTEDTARTFLRFAKITGDEIDPLVEATTRTMKAYGVSMDDLAITADKFTRIQQITGDSTLELLNAVNEGASVFQAYGLNLTDAATMLATLKDEGVPTTVALTGLRTVIDATATPTIEQTRAFEELGIATDAAGRPLLSTTEILQRLIQIAPEVAGNTDKLNAAMDLLGGRSADKMIRGLAGGSGALDKMRADVDKAAGTVEKSADRMEQAFGERLHKLWRNAFGDTIAYLAERFTWLANHVIAGLEWITTKVQEAGAFWGEVSAQVQAGMVGVADAWQTAWLSVIEELQVRIRGFLDTVLQAIDMVLAQLEKIPVPDYSGKGFTRGVFQGARAGVEAARDAIPEPTQGIVDRARGMGPLGKAIDQLLSIQLPDPSKALARLQGGSQEAQEGGSALGGSLSRARTSAGPQGGGGGGAGGNRNPADLQAELEAIEQRIELGKTSAREEIKNADAVIAKGRERKLVAKDLADLEETVHGIRQQATAEEITLIEATAAKKIASGQAGAEAQVEAIQKVLALEHLSADERIAREVELAEKQREIADQRDELARKTAAFSQSEGERKRSDLKAEMEELKAAGLDAYAINAYRAAGEKQIAQDERKFERGLEAEALAASGRETEARLIQLEIQKTEHMKTAKDKAAVERWYLAQVQAVMDEEKRAHEQLGIDVIRIVEGEREARLMELELQKQDLLKSKKDALTVETWYQAQKAQIEKTAEDANRSVTTRTAELRGQTREVAVRAIEDEVEAMRKGGADQVAIAEYVAERKKAFMEEERKARGGGSQFTTGNVYGSVEEAFAGGAVGSPAQGESFFKTRDLSLSEAGRRIDKAGKKKPFRDAQGNLLDPGDTGTGATDEGTAPGAKGAGGEPREVNVTVTFAGGVDVAGGVTGETMVKLLNELGVWDSITGTEGAGPGE